MPQRMLIDATHPEETRVVVMSGHRLEEFDFEASTRKQLKGNVYLAKIARVEPSLQAAFVEFGGNRHGFLAFNEIHPDYYQIPVADRQALAAEQAEFERDSEQREAEDGATAKPNGTGEEDDAGTVEQLGGGEADEVASRRARQPSRNYKIHEVIKKRQILLVQVVKEERGTKGAALTTYISIAGRYCVLMPNTPRGGGISRKITDVKARKKLRTIASELSVPEGMGVIIRTAGLERTKAEIKRDCDYLLRQWEQIRELTLKSTAPALIFEEANLIKRALRDLYSNTIEDVLVEGEEGHKTAKDFMRMMMPSHAKKVKLYKERVPLFQRHQVEAQLDAMHSPTVQLKSGGYIVISPTEALVAIDVNSGRSTKERNIEETAYKTNLEAADEIARQVRLRDLAGLIVADFIDMEDRRNDRNVERRFKDALKLDRARIQIGRISPFGLLEMSRQRLRPSILETSTTVCPHCGGQGHIRSTESTALHVLRAIEEEGLKEQWGAITVHVPTVIALYLLNRKRASITDIEERCGMSIVIERDESLVPPNLRIDRTRAKAKAAAKPDETVRAEEPAEAVEDADEDAAVDAAEPREAAEPRPPRSGEAVGEDGGRRPRRRRRRRDGDAAPTQGAREPRSGQTADREGDGDRDDEEAGSDVAAEGGLPEPSPAAEPGEGGEGRRPKRRRGRRGGRRRGRPGETTEIAAGSDGDGEPRHDTEVESVPLASEGAETWGGAETGHDAPTESAEPAEARPEPTRRYARKPEPEPQPRYEPEPAWTPSPASPAMPDVAKAARPGNPDEDEEAPPAPRRESTRKGWWQRLTE